MSRAAIEAELRPFDLGRLNPLGLNNTASALFVYGTEAQRLRFLPPMVRNEEKWCQLFSEPGAGSDLASLACRAERDGDVWFLTGQKVWTTWAHFSDFAIVLARTDPDVPSAKGSRTSCSTCTKPASTIRPLRHIGGEVDFNEVFLDRAVVPDTQRVGALGEGWKVATRRSRANGRWCRAPGRWHRPDRWSRHRPPAHARAAARARRRAATRQALVSAYTEEKLREWTNQRVRAQAKAGRPPGPSSVGKVHQGALNQRMQLLATTLIGPAAMAWEGDTPPEVRGMLRSRANTIEGGTTEVNKNILGERVLGLPREPDPDQGASWGAAPHS